MEWKQRPEIAKPGHRGCGESGDQYEKQSSDKTIKTKQACGDNEKHAVDAQPVTEFHTG